MINYIETSSLHCFLVLAETASFTNTAEKLFMSQSAVSQKISQMEKICKHTLFNRNGKNITLTREGEILHAYAKQIFKLHQEAFDSLTEPELIGEVHFGLPEDFATVLLADILKDFKLEHPKVTLRVDCDLTLNLLERYKHGEFDIVLAKSIQNKVSKGVDIWQEKLEWIANTDFQITKEQPLPLVLAPEPCVYRARALEALKKSKIKWQITYSSPSFAGAMAAVKAGMGISVVPHNMIPEGLSKINNKRLPNLKNTHAYILQRSSSSPAINSFFNYVVNKL